MSEESLVSKLHGFAPNRSGPISHSDGLGIVASTVWAALAFLSPQFIVQPILPVIVSLPATDNTKLFIYQLLFSAAALGIVALILRQCRLTFAAIGLTERFKLEYASKALLLLPVYLVATLALAAVTISVFPALKAEPEQQIGYSFGLGLDMILVFVVLVVAAPLVEEIIFRGLLFRAYRQRFGFVAASLLVSVLFALAHGLVLVGIDVFVLSLCLCYLRETTGSLWPGIVLHGLKNLVAFAYLFIMSMN